MKFIKRDKTKGSLTNDTRRASGIVSNNSSGNSSTTLESHRIWGQLFDGTNDVTGDMQNVGSITATGNIQTDESVIIKQLDADGNEVEGGDLTISVEDKKAKFSGKDQYVFDNQIKSDSAEIDSKLNVNGTTNLKDLNVSSDAEFKSSITVEGDSNLTNVTSTNITNSDTIKTKNLEVTGSAHFFELIIDKIKSAGGAVLFTPANGFKVDIVESVTDGYKLYWQADDGSGNQADNMWKVNDQALCMSFNQAKVGTSHNVSNKYYWCLVTEVSDNSNPIQKDGEYYHYIVISSSVCDGTVNPEIGDTIAMLGYRGTDDKKRQSAIYISAYTSLDKGLTAPLLAQYQGINDFNLESHRKSYFDAVGAKFIGNFEVNDGQSVEDYINDKINGAESETPYIGENGNWYIWDSDTKAYKDSGIKAEGQDGTNGKDAILYKMYPSNEYAVVDSDGYLYTNAQYLIYRQIGSSKTAITPLSTGYHVQYNITGSWTNATINGSYCVVNSKVKYSSTSNANYIPIRLVSGSGTLETVVDQKVIPVTYKASATLTINQELGEIKTNVQDTQNLVNSLDEDIQTVRNNTSTLEQKANSIESKVTSNTTTINNLSGSVTSLQSDMSDVKQTASSITSTVSSMKDGIIGANCMLGLNGQGWSNNTIYDDAGNSFHCESTDWFQSHPIMDFSGDYTFSFGLLGGGIQIKILEFTQTYYDDGIYNQYVDFRTYTPCKILTTSSSVSNVTLTNYATSGTSSTWTYTNTETITLAVGDNVAVRVTNSTNNRYNSIYGTVSAINTSSKSVTVKAIALLDQPNTICTLSCPMDKKDGTDINQLHYDEKLGRYWIRFKETRGSAKTFVMLFRNLSTSSVEYISRLMIEESVEYPHKYNNTGQASQSMIKQTANEIMMSVNDTYVKIGDGNITLNGDTKVNGSLTLNDKKQGFLLMGNDGTTEISPKSIGTYNEFANKTTNVIKTHYESTIYGAQSVDGNFYGFAWNVSQKLGTFKKGSYIKILNYTNVGFAIGRTPFATFHIYENGTLTKTINVGNKTSVDIANYTVVGDNVEVIVAGQFTINVSASIWGANQDTLSPRGTNKPTLHPRPSIYVTVNWNNEVPTSSAFMLIGYDGFAANFGTNTTVYCGKDGFIAKYGDSLFKITTDGIVERRNKASIEVINGSTSSSSPYQYHLKDGIDTILCKSGNTLIILPSNPYQGQKVKIHDKSQDGETWINFQGYMVRANNHYNTRTRQSKFQCDGQYVRIYTFIGDTWFEEFTG